MLSWYTLPSIGSLPFAMRLANLPMVAPSLPDMVAYCSRLSYPRTTSTILPFLSGTFRD